MIFKLKISWKKVSIVMLTYYSFMILAACCNCPDPDLPHFDYKSIKVKSYAPPPVSVYPDAGFGFSISLDEIEYLAQKKNNNFNGWGVINSGYACECAYDGDWGDKYKMTAVNIYADSTFDASVPNGEPLNSLFEVSTFINSDTQRYETIPLSNISSFFKQLYRWSEIFINSKTVPVSFDRPYYFKIEVVKDNGTAVSTTVGPIIWKY